MVGVVRGVLDHVGHDRIVGWAQNPDAPDAPVALCILANGSPIGQAIADIHRPDLEQAEIGDGRHGFEFAVPDGLPAFARHVIEVRSDQGEHLTGSPWTLDPVPDDRMRQWRGRVDQVTRQRLCGWVQDAADPDTPVMLRVFDNGASLGRVLANTYREDLREAGVGNGRHGFDWTVPGGLAPSVRHAIEIRCEADGTLISHGSVVIETVDSFDATLEQLVDDAVAALDTEAGRQHALAFLLGQIDRVLQYQSDAEGQRAERLAYRQFRRRWGPQAEVASTMPDPGLRALVIDGRVPVARRDAGSQVILSHMRALRHLGYAVSFVAADAWEPVDASGALATAGITHCAAPLYASVEDVLRRQAGCFDVVYLHREPIADRYLALARHHMPRARIIYSVADLHHLRLERQAAIEERPELLAASRRIRLAECTAAWGADAVITHSTAEAALLRQSVPQANVHVVGWDLPEDGSIRKPRRSFKQRHGVGFIGHYPHAPNLDAARWLVEAVMPLVWQTDPDIHCYLVGSAMPETIRQLAQPRVIMVGQVNDLGEAVFNRVRLTAAPLRYGAGIKGKVLESLAVGVPCVMSEIAAEGLTLPANLQDLVGQDAEAIAAVICRMHADEAANQAASEAGRLLIDRDFTADTTISALRTVLKLPASAGRPGPVSISSVTAAA